MWGLGTTIYSVIYGHISSEVVAAMTISATFQDLAWVFLIGISNACAIIVGNLLGAQEFNEAEKAASRLLKAAVIFGVILGVVIYSTIDLYSSLYKDIDDIVRVYIKDVCLVYAFVLPFKAFNSTNICGVLRSGGDLLICILLDILGVWLIAIPGGLLSAFVFKLPIVWVYAFISLEEPIKMVFSYIRYKKKIWVKNVVTPELKISE
jgi:Na+-driven multidrug efflux pump